MESSTPEGKSLEMNGLCRGACTLPARGRTPRAETQARLSIHQSLEDRRKAKASSRDPTARDAFLERKLKRFHFAFEAHVGRVLAEAGERSPPHISDAEGPHLLRHFEGGEGRYWRGGVLYGVAGHLRGCACQSVRVARVKAGTTKGCTKAVLEPEKRSTRLPLRAGERRQFVDGGLSLTRGRKGGISFGHEHSASSSQVAEAPDRGQPCQLRQLAQ